MVVLINLPSVTFLGRAALGVLVLILENYLADRWKIIIPKNGEVKGSVIAFKKDEAEAHQALPQVTAGTLRTCWSFE